jgi:heme exporter protein A
VSGQNGQPALELRQAARRFGRRWALRGVTLRVSPGEAVAVTGANGSGKSTLLRIAATAVTLTSGEGWVFGRSLRSESGAVRPLVALLGHGAGLYDDLTVAENLEFAARMLDRPRVHDAAADAMQRAGLSAHAGERVRTLSSGWQRRVAVARLWMQDPRLLLLDEPYNSFDEAGVAIVNTLIRATCERGGAALIVTHTLAPATQVMDRAVSLRAGVVTDGTGLQGQGAAPRSAAATAPGGV